METHDEIMHAITKCKTPNQLKEVRDFIEYNRFLSLGNKHFYFNKIKNQLTMLPVSNALKTNNIMFNAKRII